MKQKLFLICLSFSLSFCNNHQNRSERINNYLNDLFNYTLSNHREVLFLIPSNHCSGCGQYLLQYLKSTKNRCLLVSADESFETSNKNVTFFCDKNKEVERLNIGISNTCVVIFENKKIIYTQELKPGENIDSLLYIQY